MTPTTPITRDRFGAFVEPATLRIERRLPGPIERVWSYLTEGALRRQWLAAGDMPLAVGADFELVWRNDELSRSPAERPAGFAEEQRMTCRLTEVSPPHRLVFDWLGVGEVCIELSPADGQVLLTLTHRRLENPEMRPMVGAGWHAHLDILEACVSGTERPSFWPHWTRLHAAYTSRLPA